MRKILILEDDLQIAVHWRERLEDEGMHVVVVRSADSAIKVLDEGGIDIFISDILIRDGEEKINRLGGISVLSHINLKVRPKPKTIAVSGAHPQLNVLKHAAALKADATLAKPATPDEIFAIVNELLNEGSE